MGFLTALGSAFSSPEELQKGNLNALTRFGLMMNDQYQPFMQNANALDVQSRLQEYAKTIQPGSNLRDVLARMSAIDPSMISSLADYNTNQQQLDLQRQQINQADYGVTQGADGSLIAFNKRKPSDNFILAQGGVTPEPMSPEGKLALDVKRGFLPQAMNPQTAIDNSIKSLNNQASIAINKVDEALQILGINPTTGKAILDPETGKPVGNKAAGVGKGKAAEWMGVLGGDTYDLTETIKTIKSAVALGKLEEMRKASTTGASGLGALAGRELDLLESSLASLEVGQDPAKLARNLMQVRKHYDNWRNAINQPAPPANTPTQQTRIKWNG